LFHKTDNSKYRLAAGSSMAAIVYSTSPSRVSSTSQNQYGSYGSVNSKTLHHPSQQHHHHTMHPSSSAAPPPLSIYQAKEHHSNYFLSHSRNYKRKSAVELLAETKSYYVKSENVLDRHQQLNARSNNTLSCECSFMSLSLSLLISSDRARVTVGFLIFLARENARLSHCSI
jgi:hypothetical protein